MVGDMLFVVSIFLLGTCVGYWLKSDGTPQAPSKQKLRYSAAVERAGWSYIDSLRRNGQTIVLPTTFRWSDAFRAVVTAAGGICEE
jgi:hypothetical protein